MEVLKNLNRRSFLTASSQLALTLAISNTSIYILGSASKSLDGSLVAGAKTCGWSGHGDSGVEATCGPGTKTTLPACSELSNWGMTIFACDGSGPPGIVETQECYCF